MPTQPFADTLRAAARENADFADHLLENALNALVTGEVDEGRILLRAHVNATVGFEELGRLTRKNPKSLMRMLGPSGNPTASNLFEIIGNLCRSEGLTIEVNVIKTSAAA